MKTRKGCDMKTRHWILQFWGLSILMAFAVVHAENVGMDDILKSARRWIAMSVIIQAELPESEPSNAVQMTDSKGNPLPLWRVDLMPTGYLVMSADDTLPPVVAFDTKSALVTTSEHPLPSMLKRQGEIFLSELEKPQTRGNGLAEENKARWNRLLNHTRAESTTPSTIIRQPMLTMEWNQGAPYNYFCPSGSTYMQRALTGCVATAAAQMMKYHEWPVAGKWTKSHTDGKGDVQGTVRADFTIPYDWEAMVDNYTERNESNYGYSEFAVARLFMELGVLVDADYGMDETSARSSKLHTLMAQCLGYSDSAVYGSESGFYSRIRTEMVEGRPAFVTYTQENNGHMFIVDGLGTMGGLDYYHFNYGWGGHMSGWYLLTDGYKASVIDSATTNIQPQPVPVFKPMSCEQASSFTLSWDFPKHLTAEAFRLTKTTGTRASTVISSSIAGTARSYTLSGQSGTATYTLEAKVNGSWQAISDGMTVTVTTAPATMLELAVGDNLISIAGKQVTTTIEANNTLKSLTVTSSRPDILPANGISVTGNGASRTVSLTPTSGATGNVLLYITATDTADNTVRRTVPLAVMADKPLTWFTTKAEAIADATRSGKLVLLVTGHDNCYNTNTFRNSICEISDIKAMILENYTLWYCNYYQSYEYTPYVSGLGNTFPWIAVIDPANSNRRLRGHGGYMYADEARVFLNKNIPYFSLDDSQTYAFGIRQLLELSVLTDGAVVHYRLDNQVPTTLDPVYSSAIPLMGSISVSARAFRNGVALDRSVTKTYSFSTLTEFPEAMAVVTGAEVATYSSATPWTLQTATYNSAPSAMQSGTISDNGTSTLVAKVNGPGTLSFYWRASSETDYDKLTFSIDGTVQASISGSSSWVQKNYTVTGDGDHYLTWTYAKDYSDSANSDCAWVDDIVWTPTVRTLTSIAINGDATIATASTANYTCTATWSDGTTSTVTPTWSINPTTYASVSTSGIVTNRNTTTSDQSVTLTASYTAGNVAKTDSKSITLETVVQPIVQTLSLAGGWNWVGFFILPNSRQVGNVLGTAGFAVNDVIQTNTGSSRFNGVSWIPSNFTIDYGKLYMVNVSSPVTITVKGTAAAIESLAVISGWNWIANPTDTVFKPSLLGVSGDWTAGDCIQGATNSVRYSGRKWIPSTGFTLEPGKGYQLFSAKSGRITFSANGTGTYNNDDPMYLVVDLSGGPNAENYPVRYTDTPPNLDDDTCRTTELWLRRIPAGKFIMGSAEKGSYLDQTQHEVTLTKDYYIGVFECTQKQWELVYGSKPFTYKGDCRPVERVRYQWIRGGNWPTDAHIVNTNSMIGLLQKKTGLTFDLPTEAQWEYACRAGTTTDFNSGKNLTSTYPDSNMDEVGRYNYNQSDGKSGYSQHTIVGKYLPNAWGLYDMHGNVSEFCLDLSGSLGADSVEDPLGPNTGTYHIHRGGAWAWNAKSCSSAYRTDYPEDYDNCLGFRLVCLP
ncbi:MAG: C10 family peptidase [Victivallales bacterium]|nr:C10 family peptidase [Victivallales bacterium]